MDMNIKTIDEEVKASQSLLKTFGPWLNGNYSYVILLTSALLCFIKYTQSYHIQQRFQHQSPSNSIYLIFGVFFFIFFQTKYFYVLVENVCKWPVVWLVLSAGTCALPFFFGGNSSHNGELIVLGYKFNLSLLNVIFVIIFFSLVVNNQAKLSVTKIVIYNCLFDIIIAFCFVWSNIPMAKYIFLLTLGYLSVSGKRRLAVESAILMILFFMIIIFLSPFRVHRLMIIFNPEADSLNVGYQTMQALRAWANAEWVRIGFRGPIKFGVPKMANEMAFSATVQLWGRVGACVIFLITPLQILSFLKTLNTCLERKTGLLAFGICLLYFQSVSVSLLMAIGLYPPSIQLAGAGLLSDGSGTLFTLIALGLAYRVTKRQKQTSFILLVDERLARDKRPLDVFPLIVWVLFISALLVSLALYATTVPKKLP